MDTFQVLSSASVYYVSHNITIYVDNVTAASILIALLVSNLYFSFYHWILCSLICNLSSSVYGSVFMVSSGYLLTYFAFRPLFSTRSLHLLDFKLFVGENTSPSISPRVSVNFRILHTRDSNRLHVLYCRTVIMYRLEIIICMYVWWNVKNQNFYGHHSAYGNGYINHGCSFLFQICGRN